MTKSVPPSRRKFLGTVGGATAASIAANAVGLPALSFLTTQTARATQDDDGGGGQRNGNSRRVRAKQVRDRATQEQFRINPADHVENGDERRYASRIGSFTKGLRHNALGEVNAASYNAYLGALGSGRFSDFEALVTNGHFGCSDPTRQRRLVNPQAGYAFDLIGADSHVHAMRPAPAFASAEEAGEMVELYWMALLRDVNFEDYAAHPLAAAAAADLSQMTDFRGPKQAGQVTPQTLFRDNFAGCTTGPYISQFLLQPVHFGAQDIDTRIRTNAPGVDFMTSFPEWLDIQNGCNPTRTLSAGGNVYCRNGRDLGQFVHIDALFQAYFIACLNLLGGGYLADAGNPYGVIIDGGAGRPRNSTIDPNGSLSQVAFGTFGGPAILTLVCEPASRALKDVWYQKWLVHRRLRPEEFGGRVEVQRTHPGRYPIHPDLLTRSAVLSQVFAYNAAQNGGQGTWLLPVAFPEGSPVHTSYGSGHATVAGAAVTILKAIFDESQPIQNPVVPTPDGSALVPYFGPTLTVGGELNKVASNVATGRNIGGVHWRTDATESIKLGEDCAISMLKDMRGMYNEPFNGFSLTKFDGTTITV